MVYTYIARGPKGTIARVLARTAQLDSTSYKATYPGPNDLRVVTIIRNNTQTTYTDTQGDDETLTATPDLVRIDHKWPRRGKYLVANDGRFMMGGAMKPNPAAILLAPTGITATRDLNQYGKVGSSTQYIDDLDDQRADEYLASPGTRGFYLELDGTSINLIYDSGSALTTTAIALRAAGNWRTLQQLIDLINQTLVGGTGKEWAAQLVPGVDGDTTAEKLAPTTSSTAAGDGARAGGGGTTADYLWCRGPGEPVVIYFTKAYLDTFPTDDQAIEFTRGGPSDTPAAIMNWSASKECERKPGDAFVGRYLGAAPIQNTFVVFYEHGIYALRPVQQGSSADSDMRLYPIIVGNVHVVSDSAIFWGAGFAGCMTHQGVMVTDGVTHALLPDDIYNHDTGVGEWLNEITRSLKATQAGGRTAAPDESYLYAAVLGHQLHVSYRKSTTAANDRRLVLDFSPAAEAGLPVFQNLAKYGWSAPLTNTVGAMAEIADQSGGMVRYGVVENVAQGRVDKFDTGLTDNGVAVGAVGYFRTDMCGTARLKQLAGGIVTVYKKNGTGMSVAFARDQGTSPTAHGTATTTALATTGTLLYGRVVLDLPPEARTAADVFEVSLTDDGSGDPCELWRILLPYSVTAFPR
jgi:hypothetical protein